VFKSLVGIIVPTLVGLLKERWNSSREKLLYTDHYMEKFFQCRDNREIVRGRKNFSIIVAKKNNTEIDKTMKKGGRGKTDLAEKFQSFVIPYIKIPC
jgi:hypothetical protein